MDPQVQVPDVPGHTAGLSVLGTHCVHTAAVAHAGIVIVAVDGTVDDEVFDDVDVFVVNVVVVIQTFVAVEYAADEVAVAEVDVAEADVVEDVVVEYVVVAVVDWLLVVCSACVAEEDCPLDNIVVDVHTSESPVPRPQLHCSYCTYWADPPSPLVHLS